MRGGSVHEVFRPISCNFNAFSLSLTLYIANAEGKDGFYRYNILNDDTIEIVSCASDDVVIKIPSTLDGRTVTAIKFGAFDECGSLDRLLIPNSVTSIDGNIFSGCRKLTKIYIAENHPTLSSINGVLFNKENSSLICYPAGKPDDNYSIPEGTISIENDAFRFCKALRTLELPDSLTQIGNSAFHDCESLEYISLPDSIETIGANPFSLCRSLNNISISIDHPKFAVIDGVLFSKDDKRLISYPAGKVCINYTIPTGITSIGENAFSGSELLKYVTIPDSVTHIGAAAFSNCWGLEDVSSSNNIDIIGNGAFAMCFSLTSFTIPNHITSIGNQTFAFCSSLKNITIPDSVTMIGDYAFSSCASLKEVSIPNSVVSIGVEAFSDCPNLLLVVSQDSYALQYAKENGITYTYPNANDWLNN